MSEYSTLTDLAILSYATGLFREAILSGQRKSFDKCMAEALEAYDYEVKDYLENSVRYVTAERLGAWFKAGMPGVRYVVNTWYKQCPIGWSEITCVEQDGLPAYFNVTGPGYGTHCVHTNARVWKKKWIYEPNKD